MRKLILLTICIISSCATKVVTPQSKPNVWEGVDPLTIRCLDLALNSGAYDTPPKECIE